ncbi:hypothetical protein VNI00_014803 [Paramarasmius palmivorus]|uniref:Uncharacterized protein n=1 Tax=Paramarasmius palmivorus TaxID=297713 RepID=A0AAW0BQM3_9AGAR
MSLLYPLRLLDQDLTGLTCLTRLRDLCSTGRQSLHDFLDLVPRASHQIVQPILLSPWVILPHPTKNGFLADEEQVARQKNRHGRILLSLTLTPKPSFKPINANLLGPPYTNNPRYIDLAPEKNPRDIHLYYPLLNPGSPS